MGVRHRPVTAPRMDVAHDDPPACFVLVCLCCYNLDRLEHETVAEIVENSTRVQYRCLCCAATMRAPAAS